MLLYIGYKYTTLNIHQDITKLYFIPKYVVFPNTLFDKMKLNYLDI